MQVMRIEEQDNRDVRTERPSQEHLQREFNYLQAERITKKLLEKRLITIDESDLIFVGERLEKYWKKSSQVGE